MFQRKTLRLLPLVFFKALFLVAAISVEAVADDPEFSDGTDAENYNRGSLSPTEAQMGQPNYAGSGCPDGTVSAALTPDKKTLSLLFDSFVATAGDGTGRDRRDCQIRIPVAVPRGLHFSIVKLDYRGFVSAPHGAKAKFLAKLTMLGSALRPLGETVHRQKVFVGPKEKEFFLRAPVHMRPVWSACGTSSTIAIDNRLVAVTNARGEITQVTLDSLDTNINRPHRKLRVNYHVFWRRCR